MKISFKHGLVIIKQPTDIDLINAGLFLTHIKNTIIKTLKQLV